YELYAGTASTVPPGVLSSAHARRSTQSYLISHLWDTLRDSRKQGSTSRKGVSSGSLSLARSGPGLKELGQLEHQRCDQLGGEAVCRTEPCQHFISRDWLEDVSSRF